MMERTDIKPSSPSALYYDENSTAERSNLPNTVSDYRIDYPFVAIIQTFQFNGLARLISVTTRKQDGMIVVER